MTLPDYQNTTLTPNHRAVMYRWHRDRAVKELARLDEKQASPFHQHNEPYQAMLQRQRGMWEAQRDEAVKRMGE